MLGCLWEDIGFPDDYFEGEFLPEWFDDPFVKRIVKEVDSSDVIGANKIVSPVLGDISCNSLSTGCKNLIIAHKCDGFC